MADEILTVEELRKAQAAAQAQGTSITNYNHWEQILTDLETAGIQSTGNYDGDVKLHSQMMETIQKLLETAQDAQMQQKNSPINNETVKVDKISSNEREQELKANVANATSSTIMADYMKYYHLLD